MKYSGKHAVHVHVHVAGCVTKRSFLPFPSSFTDHPLCRLLGECQYNIYMMLQPVGTAIEKAGGLPRLEIRLDNCGMDRKPSEGQWSIP